MFGNSNSNNSDNKIDTSFFVQKPYLRTNYIEANIEEDIDLKNKFRLKNLPDPISIREACSKNYVDNSIDESSLLRLDPNETPDLNNQDSIILNSTLTDPKTIIEIPTKAYIDSLHEENERSRRDLGIDFYNESDDLVKNNQTNNFNDNINLNVKSIQINDDRSDNSHAVNKLYVDDELDKKTIVRFNQTLQNYLKVSVGNDIYNLTKYDKIQLTDTTINKAPNSGGYLLQNWNIECNDKNNNGKVNNFIRSTKSSSPTADSGASSLRPIGDSFMYFETSSKISNITFYYNRFSISDDNLRSMGRIRIQLLLENNVWTTQNTINKNSQYNNNSTDWSLLNINFTSDNYGIKLIYDQIDTAHADMCFSNITITHSVY